MTAPFKTSIVSIRARNGDSVTIFNDPDAKMAEAISKSIAMAVNGIPGVQPFDITVSHISQSSTVKE